MVIAELFAKLGLNVDEQTWGKGDKFLKTVRAGLAGIVAGFGIHKLYEMIEGVADLADSASKMALKLGISTEAVQELGYAAELSDISTGELQASLNIYSRGLDTAKKGTGQFADALRALHVRYGDLKKQSLDEQLGTLADAFQKMPDGPKKAAFAMALFGETGTKLIPLLNEGKSGLQDLRQEARDLGIVVDTETAKSFEEFNDDQTRLKETWRGLKTQVVTALLPALREMVETIKEWLKHNQEAIRSTLTTVIDGLILAFHAFIEVMKVAGVVLDFFAKHSDLTKAILLSLTVVLGYFAAAAIAAWVAAAAPVIAFIAILTAVILAVKDIWDGITEGKGVSIRIWRAIRDAAQEFGDYILSLPGRLLDAVVSIAKSISDAFGRAFDYIKEKAKETWEKIRNAPVIKQVIDAGEFIFGGSGNSSEQFTRASQLSSTQTVVPSPMVVPSSIQMGDTSISVTAAPGMDTEQLGQHIQERVNDAWGGKIQEAFTAMRGGRR